MNIFQLINMEIIINTSYKIIFLDENVKQINKTKLNRMI